MKLMKVIVLHVLLLIAVGIIVVLGLWVMTMICLYVRYCFLSTGYAKFVEFLHIFCNY